MVENKDSLLLAIDQVAELAARGAASNSLVVGALRQAHEAISTLPIAGEGKVEWDSPEEMEIEQRAFQAVSGRSDVPADVQQLVAKLWAMYCHAAAPSSPGKDGGQEVEAVGEVEDRRRLLFSNDWIREKIAADGDAECDIDPVAVLSVDLNPAALSVPAAAVVGEPVAWQPRYKQEVIDHLRTVSDNVSEFAMTVFQTKAQAEDYGHGGHEVRPLYAAPSAPEGCQPDAGQQWFLDRIGEEITAGRMQNALTYLSCAFAEDEKKFETADKLRVFWNDKAIELSEFIRAKAEESRHE